MPIGTLPASDRAACLSGSALVDRLLDADLLPESAWAAVPEAERDEIAGEPDAARLLQRLVARRWLTPFQAGHIGRTGSPAGLIFGNYRLREPLGASDSGLFRVEHRRLKSTAGVGVFLGDHPPVALARFFGEIEKLMACRHPGLARVLDAGEQPDAGPDGESRPYAVLELPGGQTLGEWVRDRGPLPTPLACHVGHQLADALAEAHGRGLFHRRLHPGTVFLTPEGCARLLHFGASSLMPPDGATAGYSAPELIAEPHRSDPRADLYSLAAILSFALTGRPAFPPSGPRWPEGLPEPLMALLDRMTEPDPEGRPSSASDVRRGLEPFVGGPLRAEVGEAAIAPELPRVLIADDDRPVRRVVRDALAEYALQIVEADDGEEAAELLRNQAFDLVSLDADLPKVPWAEVLRRARENPASPHTKAIVLSRRDDPGAPLADADDFLPKPFSPVQLHARVASALKLKRALDRSERLAATNSELELACIARGDELVHAKGAIVMALAKLVEQRNSETGSHLLRLQRYSRVLGEAAAATEAFGDRLPPVTLEAIQQAAPLHDIGKVAVPDRILNKPGALTPEERVQIQAHAAAGADTLSFVTDRFPFASDFFGTAIEIARHHHEKWDGSGYPGRLAGEAIPLAARLVAVGDVYDALRSTRIYKSGEDHPAAVRRMLDTMPGHFDPGLLGIFAGIHDRFREVFDGCAD